jgi:hypothetical protein
VGGIRGMVWCDMKGLLGRVREDGVGGLGRMREEDGGSGGPLGRVSHLAGTYMSYISRHCQSFSTRVSLPTRSHSSPDQAVQNMLRSLIRPPRSPHRHPCQPPTDGGRPKGLCPICPSGLPPLAEILHSVASLTHYAEGMPLQ